MTARHGYAAEMPDLFSARGPRPICVARTMVDASRGKVSADVDARRAWLAEQSNVDGERIGVIGFCMGGVLRSRMSLEDARARAPSR
jgi:carboxymethylenebutenolidase